MRASFLLVAAALIVVAPTAWAQGPLAASLFVSPGPGAVAMLEMPADALRQRFVGIDFGGLEETRAQAESLAPGNVRLNLFDDAVFEAVVTDTGPTSAGYWLTGHLVGQELATVSLVVNGDVVAGTVRAPGGTYAIRRVGGDLHAIRHLDPAAFPSLGSDARLPPVLSLPEPSRVEPIRPPVSSRGAPVGVDAAGRGRLAHRPPHRVLTGRAGEARRPSFPLGADRSPRHRDQSAVRGQRRGSARAPGARGGAALCRTRPRPADDPRPSDVPDGRLPGRGPRFAGPLRGGRRPLHRGQARDRWNSVGRQRVLRFSNPYWTFNGDPTGVQGSAPSSSVDGPSDARASLNATRELVANFRRAPCLDDGTGIRLQASNGQYVVALNNGGGRVLVNRDRPSAWGRLYVVDLDGGCLASGDTVALRTSDGYYLRADGGGGSTLSATGRSVGRWERLRLRRRVPTGAGRHGRSRGPSEAGTSSRSRPRAGTTCGRSAVAAGRCGPTARATPAAGGRSRPARSGRKRALTGPVRARDRRLLPESLRRSTCAA